MDVDREARVLIELVRRDRDARCEAIRAEARARCAAIAGDAWRDARERMRAAFADEHARRDERLAAAHAELATRRRFAEQQRASALLEVAWNALPAALAARWHDADARRNWVDSAIAAASAALPRGRWRVRHASGLRDDERESALARIASAAGTTPSIEADPGITAGLSIAVDGTVVDATATGLVADAHELDAALLQALDVAVKP